MKISNEVELDFDDVLITPNRTSVSSRAEVDLTREFYFYHSPRKWTGIPVMCANMSSVAGFDMATQLAKNKMITCLHKYIEPEDFLALKEEERKLTYGECWDYIWPSIGFSESEKNRLKAINEICGYTNNVCIDVPSAYMEEFVKYCKEIREEHPQSIIMAGNVVSGDMAKELIIHGGVDIVKVGIGPGSNCSTRAVTGVGRPQFAATLDVSYNTHGLKSSEKHLGLMCTDGGLRNSGDIAKAFCVGADFVMLGGMFAGTEQCCGEWEYHTESTYDRSKVQLTQEQAKDLDFVRSILRGGGVVCSPDTFLDFHEQPYALVPKYTDKKKNLIHYGMSTHYAQEVHGTGKKEYRASEGVLSKIPYKGPVQTVINEILGGLRSTGAYLGANRLKDFSKCANFIRVNRIHHNYGNQILGL
jgi:GMP reductase